MRQKRIKCLLILNSLAILGILMYFIIPIVLSGYHAIQETKERAAFAFDFARNTTPLTSDVIADLCTKFEIDLTDKRCQSDSVVYAPMFFDDIKGYFWQLPDSEATYQTVDNKLGAYLVMCERPNPEGNYRCHYDITGDGVYPIFIHFDKDGFYFRIMANIGGS